MNDNKERPNYDNDLCCTISRQTDPNVLEVKTPSQLNLHKKNHSSMIPIEGGKFLMGSNSNAIFREDGEGPVREIEIGSFFLAEKKLVKIPVFLPKYLNANIEIKVTVAESNKAEIILPWNLNS